MASVKITAFDFTCAQIRQAKRSASHSSADGCRLVTTRSPSGTAPVHGLPRFDHEVALLHERGAEDRANLEPAASQPIEIGGDDAHVRLAGEDRPGVGLDGRRDHGLDERRHDRFGRRAIQRPVERDDAAEGGHGVRVAGAHVGVGGRRADRGAARVGVLDHGGRRLVEFEHDARGRIEIEQVRVRQLLALQDGRVAEAAQRSAVRAPHQPVPGRALMRVLAVSQIANLLERARRGDRPPDRSGVRAPAGRPAIRSNVSPCRSIVASVALIAVSYAPVCASALRISS